MQDEINATIAENLKELGIDEPIEVLLKNLSEISKVQKARTEINEYGKLRVDNHVNTARPCMKILIANLQHDAYWTHRQRLAVCCELINIGAGDDAILNIFSSMADFDASITLYQVSHARKSKYKPFKCDNLKRLFSNECKKSTCKSRLTA